MFVILLLLRAGESTDSDPYNFGTYNGVHLWYSNILLLDLAGL